MADIETQKSLALAELMGWEQAETCPHVWFMGNGLGQMHLHPYSKSYSGLAQFAAILLKFPRVFCRFTEGDLDGFTSLLFDDGYHDKLEPTQANVLDEILKMQGKWQEEWND